ncbi:hypothetical protein BBF96_11480 [Anoxybacter fermentans]|uniref:Uncharacterized protein n=2 Tax=Anoxybacter fermentans TaxID=1323375 RepID=A0A3S9T0B5_9FIRM|nr:hypothetical protein BBF96_11480 [Anoxybacter fermentans]
MRKTLTISIMALMMVLVMGFAANAGTWEITSHYMYHYTTSWDAVQSYYNYSYTQTDSIDYTYTDTKYVEVSAKAGLSDVVEAEVGFTAGQSITKSYNFHVSIAPRTKRTLYCRWVIEHHYGLADYYNDWWNPFDGSDEYNVYWYEDVPDYLEGMADEISI